MNADLTPPTPSAFTLWKERVEAALQDMYHVTSYDLPDAPYFSYWSRRMSPERAARAAIRNAATY